MNLASLRPHVALWGLRSAWALAIALWALALVPWFRTPPVAPLAAAPAAAPAALRGAASAPEAVARAPAEAAAEAGDTPPGAKAVAAAEPTAAPAERVGREGAVCGLSEGAGAAAEAPTPALRASHLARQANQGLVLAFDALRLRGETTAQAAGWWLRVLVAREGAAAEPSAACAAGADCAPAGLPTAAAAADALAQLAQLASGGGPGGGDAWVQQVAQRACDGVSSALCTSLGTRRWTTQEPDNAAAWLELAAREPQAADEALFRAARAVRFDGHRGRLTAQVLQATPESLPPMQRYAAWQRADELERAADAKVVAAAARVCSDAARRDANRDQLCDAAARWLAQQRPPAGDAATGARALDCASVERAWREARDASSRRAVQASATARP